MLLSYTAHNNNTTYLCLGKFYKPHTTIQKDFTVYMGNTVKSQITIKLL